tara:strand:- start:1810 stop:2157 length:348 start_codon:yes stop_codon:yes gene_type:complete
MAFKLDQKPYCECKLNTPVYTKPLEDGILGEAQMNGTILVSDKMKNVDQINDTIDHEAVHIDQMKTPFKLASGEITKLLSYDDDNVYWKGKIFPRSKMSEGDSELPWEAEAYKKA